jgi:DNA repair photolyase
MSNVYSKLTSVRWDSLRADDKPVGVVGDGPGSQAQLALFDRASVARTFDTPGFAGMTFHEVHAKSIINRVPDASRVPFRWTINPYRGCSHACAYCMAGETPILMADGRTRSLADVRAGDLVYGTVREGAYRRYGITTVLAHWSVVKPAYCVTLEDDTRLICSEDHRFLTNRGWRYVTGAEHGAARRPHLTPGTKLMGVGAFAEPPKASAEYRRGYLCGMLRGDGHVRLDRRSTREPFQFRLALVDREALERTSGYLRQVGISCRDFAFAGATGTGKRIDAIRCCGREQLHAIQWLIRWPDEPATDWRKGFLAGIFDAEGSTSNGVLRVASTDRETTDWTTASLEALGFRTAVDQPSDPNGLAYVRLVGGLKERLRFFHSTDPAIDRKRSVVGTAIKCSAGLGVVSVQPLGADLEMYDITTGTGDFIAEGVVSHNCFARKTHTYLDFDAGRDFNTQIVVKVNAPELARRELASAKWQGEHVAMGTNVDCYQRAEGRYRLMPGIIGALRDAANPFSILTEGTLILRDLDLLAEAATVTDVGLNVSVGFVDKEISRSVEPGTPSPERRLGVCAAITDRGLRCGVLMGPVLPFLTDSPDQLETTVRLAAEAGAAHLSPIVLHLRPGAREWFLQWLGETHPDLVSRYRELYRGGAYAAKAYQQQIAAQVAGFAAQYGIGRTGPRGARRVRLAESARQPAAAPPAEPPPAEPPLAGPVPPEAVPAVQLPLL